MRRTYIFLVVAALIVGGLIVFITTDIWNTPVCAAGDPCPCTDEYRFPDCTCLFSIERFPLSITR